MINLAGKPGAPVVITHEGLPKVVMMSFQEFEGLMETLDVMANPKEAADILKRLRNMHKEESVSLEDIKMELFMKSIERGRKQAGKREGITQDKMEKLLGL